MELQEIISVVFSLVGSLVLVCLAVLIGWYLVWKFFLSRFRLVRELLGHMHDNSTPTHTFEKETKKSKSKKIRRD